MQSFKEYVDNKRPFQIEVAEKVIDCILKKNRLKNDVTVKFTDKLEITFKTPCSERILNKLQDELDKAGLTVLI